MSSTIKYLFLLACVNLCASYRKWNTFLCVFFLHEILTVLYFPVFRLQKLNNNLSFWNHTSFYSYWLPLCQKSQICESCSHRRHQRVSCPSILQQARSHVRAQIEGKHKKFTSSAVVIIIWFFFLICKCQTERWNAPLSWPRSQIHSSSPAGKRAVSLILFKVIQSH